MRQIQEQAETVDWTSDLTIDQRATVTCPSCHAKVAGGKFCSSCGTGLQVSVACRSCGFAHNAAGAVFCSECGTGLV